MWIAHADMTCSGQTDALTLAGSLLEYSMSTLLFHIGRLAETPDALAIWPQQSQEGRCVTPTKGKEDIKAGMGILSIPKILCL